MAGTELDPLTEMMVDSYLRWRAECDAVRAAYERFSRSGPHDRHVNFARYDAALHLEEQAAREYQRTAERFAEGAP